jgi:myo-inositol-1(or 4)-monophosphatase
MLGCRPVGAVDLVAADALVRELLPRTGALALQHFRSDLVAEDKTSRFGYDPVTEADRGIETILRDAVAERFPDHRFIGEEWGTTGPDDAAATWIVDPIDGTKAFVTGSTGWGTLIGLVVAGRAVAGWAHQPFLDEVFSGVDGVAAYDRGDQRTSLRTRPTTRLDEAVLYSTHPSMFCDGDEPEVYERLRQTVRLQRYGGDCYAYCLLALGFVDLVVENQLHSYDIVPLVPIIEAAGGVVTSRAGGSPLDGGFVVAAATPELHEQTLACLNQE